MKIGMIGLQSRHLDFFTAQINVEKRFPGVSVTAVWGDDEPERLPDIATELRIPAVCRCPEELFELCDTVFVLPRDGRVHMQYARMAQAAGKDLFVDKPFAMCRSDADELIETARQKGLALSGGSTLCYLPMIRECEDWVRESSVCTISYFADPDSIYGGWAYYGSHLCDLCARLFGIDAKTISAQRHEKNVTVSVQYANRQVLLRSTPYAQRPAILIGSDLDEKHKLDDDVCFRYGLEGFIAELQSRSGESFARLRASATLLEGSLLSLRTGKTVSF